MQQPVRTIPPLAGIALAAAIGVGCSDNSTEPPSRPGREILVPADMSLAEAANQAVAGDTISILGQEVVTEPVVFASSQTPLLVRANRSFTGAVSGPADKSLLQFESPRAGTRISELGFTGGQVAVDARNSGEILVENCSFSGGEVQVSGTGPGLTVTVEKCIMRNPTLFGIRVSGGARTNARSNTILGAGDCGMLITSGASGAINNCIVYDSVNYGVACLDAVLLAESGCNDIFLSGVDGEQHYLNCAKPDSDFHADPQFCGADGGDYTITSTSPCHPNNSDGCELVGALPPRCEPPSPGP